MENEEPRTGSREVGANRRGSRRRIARATLLLATVGALAISGCGSGSGGGSAGAKSGGSADTLTIGLDGAPVSIDPAQDVYGTFSQMRWFSNDTILRMDPKDGSYGPGLATEFGFVGKENKAYEFTLRQDATFSNGKPVNAAAVKAWFEYFMKDGGSMKALLPLESVETPDEWTVRLHFSESAPNAPLFMAATNWAFVSDASDPKALASQTLGSGPYKLDASSTVKGDTYVFEPNERYGDKGAQHYKRVVFKVMKSPATALRALRAGELDIAFGNTSTAAAAEKTSGVNVIHDTDGGFVAFDIMDRNGKLAKPLGDVRVRQALNYAVDRKAVTAAMVGKYARPISAWLTQDGNVPELENAYPYDPQKAKQLLTEAGYPNGFSFTVLDKSFAGNMGDPMVQAVAADWQKVGVKVDVTAVSTPAQFYETMPTGEVSTTATEYALATVNLLANSRYLVNGGTANPFKVDDEGLTKLLETARSAPPEQAGESWQAVTRYVVDQALMVPIFSNPILVYAGDDVAGLDQSVTKFLQYAPALVAAHPAQ